MLLCEPRMDYMGIAFILSLNKHSVKPGWTEIVTSSKSSLISITMDGLNLSLYDLSQNILIVKLPWDWEFDG